jgi:hypothetical protein
MELKVFRANGHPNERADDLKVLLTPDPSTWEIIAKCS